jgi:hypothetical protein
MSKLLLDPAQGSYSARHGPETIAVALAGGRSRYRRDQLGAAAMAQVEWFLAADQYDYLMAFYRSRAAHGSSPFTLDAILDSAPLQEYTAYFVPGTLELSAIQGSVYIVAAQLEVIPKVEDATRDLGLVLYREAEATPAGPLDLTLMNASLSFANGQISHSSFGWHGFYSAQNAADSLVASWRYGTPGVGGTLAIAGLLPFVPVVDGDGSGYGAGAKVIYARNDSNTVSHLSPTAGFQVVALGLAIGDQYTVIIKDGVAYHYRTVGDSVEFLVAHAAAAGNYRFGGQLFSGRISDVKLAVF